jgi:glycosyltransferase involved in cell wall biosynthesis
LAHRVAPDAVLFVFCGLIREYKGIPDLLEAFYALPTHLPAHLIIAGECNGSSLHGLILGAAGSDPRVTYLPGYLTDADLSSYLRAADYVCLPFRRLTTSSSVMLALSHGRPVIAPLLGDLVHLPVVCGYLYDPGSPDNLRKALFAAAEAGPPERSRTEAIASFMAGASWAPVARATIAAYGRDPGEREERGETIVEGARS